MKKKVAKCIFLVTAAVLSVAQFSAVNSSAAESYYETGRYYASGSDGNNVRNSVWGDKLGFLDTGTEFYVDWIEQGEWGHISETVWTSNGPVTDCYIYLPFCTAESHINDVNRGGLVNEIDLWNYFHDKLGNSYGTAAIMANLYYESALRSNNLEDQYEGDFNDITYTAAVDNGSYDNFVGDSYGYGLAQFTFSSRKRNLLENARNNGVSVGNAQMQMDFIYKELKEQFAPLLNDLCTTADLWSITEKFMIDYENPADKSTDAVNKRYNKALEFYSTYASQTPDFSQPTTTTTTAVTTQPIVTTTTAVTQPVVNPSETPSNSDRKYTVGEMVYIGEGIRHHVSAYDNTNGYPVKSGWAKVTAVCESGKYQYHVIGFGENASNCYGWVSFNDESDSSSSPQTPVSKPINVGTKVYFKGGTHYVTAESEQGNGYPSAGYAVVTFIAPGTKHPYHIVHSDGTSTVYGFVSAEQINAV